MPRASLTQIEQERLPAPAQVRLTRRPRLAWSSYLWALAVVPFIVFYVVSALRLPLPVYLPDEELYQHLARSLADGQGFSWRGAPISLRAALYVYLISPAWLVASGVRAYEVAKVETAMLSCLVAVPVWLLARELLPRTLLALMVALSLAGTWMLGGLLMTESVALPLATGCLGATVLGLRRASSRLLWIAVLLALLASWARLQLVVLLPIVLVALVLDIARRGVGRGRRARLHRGPVLLLVGICGLGAAALIVDRPLLLGGYGGIANYRPSAGQILDASGQQLLQLAPLSGFLPLMLLGVLVVRPRAWRDEIVGPFLAVLVPTIVVLALQNGFFVKGYGVGWSIQRYMIYAAPLLLVFCVAALMRSRLVGWRTLAATVALSLLPLLTADVAERSEQRAAFGTTERLHDLLPGASTGLALTTVSVALCLCAVALAAVGVDRRRMAAVVGSLLLIVLSAQTVTATNWQIGVARQGREAALPRNLTWVDQHSHGPVAALTVTANSTVFAAVDFFNKNIARYYAQRLPVPGPILQGASCPWAISPTGAVVFPRDCPPNTDQFFLNDPAVRLHFTNEVASWTELHLGRLVTLRGAPQLKSVVTMPCARNSLPAEPVTLRLLPGEPQGCNAVMNATLWVASRAMFAVAIRGAPVASHNVTIAGKTLFIPPRRLSTIRIPLQPGRNDAALTLDWNQTGPLTPHIVGVDLVKDGRRESLL